MFFIIVETNIYHEENVKIFFYASWGFTGALDQSVRKKRVVDSRQSQILIPGILIHFFGLFSSIEDFSFPPPLTFPFHRDWILY